MVSCSNWATLLHLCVGLNAVYALLSPADRDLTSSSLLAQADLKQPQTAIEIYDIVLSRDASDYLSFYKRATAHLLLSQSKRALEDLEAVLRIAPDFEQASRL